jgi:hypothetical protein
MRFNLAQERLNVGGDLLGTKPHSVITTERQWTIKSASKQILVIIQAHQDLLPKTPVLILLGGMRLALTILYMALSRQTLIRLATGSLPVSA